ncbi:DUF4194 domain-containing protein [Pseudomonas kermanshahensis]|uniref:DUF4194 domain-containing protein n=1 Tax=Pseudomonas kermanshahensis TaxID=2745482 RepID=UPI0023DB597C|nr:DUF4194 domain-containing protein [Pseudomonas kermanshahensis]WEL53635.1 DUF4194 domain-containing protein [Pseudomonas kermanshahensis]
MAGIFDRIAGAGNTSEWESGAEITEREGRKEEQTAQAPSPEQDEERRTPPKVRDAVQEMLKYGLLEESQKPNLYRVALTHTEQVSRILEPLDLAVGIDEVRGLVFVTVRQTLAEDDDWSHPLVRRQRLNLEQSLLIAILRQHFIVYEQERGTGANLAQVAVDELIPQLQVYLGELGSEAGERNRIITILDQLKGHGLVSAVDAHDRVVIRPIITHLANPQNLQALVAWLRAQIEGPTVSEAEGGEDEA